METKKENGLKYFPDLQKTKKRVLKRVTLDALIERIINRLNVSKILVYTSKKHILSAQLVMNTSRRLKVEGTSL